MNDRECQLLSFTRIKAVDAVTNLEDQKSFVIEINTATLEQCGDFAKVAGTIVNGVFARVVPMSSPRDDQLRSGDDFVRI